MNCPVCAEKMREIEKLGVEIDICPNCKGVWLDRGELEKILAMEKSAGSCRKAEGEPDREHHRHSEKHHGEQAEKHCEHHDKHHGGFLGEGQGKHGRRRSLLGEIFDGFGDD